MKKVLLVLFFSAITFIANAQYTKLLDFAGSSNGQLPCGSLISDGTFLFGMTEQGGTNDFGVIFKIKTNGTGYVKLLDFAGSSNGRYPVGSLITDGTFLYGMTRMGGTNDKGVIFKIKPDGTGYLKLLDFAGSSNGASPNGSLVTDGVFLYGMTTGGGSNNFGVIFKIKTDGTGYIKLLDFIESNGSYPRGSFIYDGTFLFGTAGYGGINNYGVVFKIRLDGSGYSAILDFAGSSNGVNPFCSLISDGIFLYGMTAAGGTNNNGVVFKIKPDGTEYLKLLDFAGSSNGQLPYGSLISDGTFLYGMTFRGGANDKGVIIKIKTDGTGFVKLLDFAGSSNGRSPHGSLFSDGTSLYGMALGGGINDMGVIFKYSLTTGIDEDAAANNISISPNPFTNELKINSNANGEVILFDITGKEILRQKTFDGATTLDTEKLSSGFYLLHFSNGKTNENYKVIKI